MSKLNLYLRLNNPRKVEICSKYLAKYWNIKKIHDFPAFDLVLYYFSDSASKPS